MSRAAELGDAEAHHQLACSYREGEGVEMDEKKRVYHLEEAAVRGHHTARYGLGSYEWNNGRFERAAKHFIIAANLGDDGSMKVLRSIYAGGNISKDTYLAALRGYQEAIDATKSPQREAVEEFIEHWLLHADGHIRQRSKDDDYEAALRAQAARLS